MLYTYFDPFLDLLTSEALQSFPVRKVFAVHLLRHLNHGFESDSEEVVC
jgi:hypothetical protein